MVLGIIVGQVIHSHYMDLAAAAADDAAKKEISTALANVAGYFNLLTQIFLRMIKMVISPLVFATLIAGIAHMGGGASVGRIGGKSLLWFITASLVSLTLGLIMVTVFQPGNNQILQQMMSEAVKTNEASTALGKGIETMSLQNFVLHVIPSSIADSIANNEILQIVFFSVFFGIALAAMGEKGHLLLEGIETLSHVMLKVTGYVMYMAPFGVFGAMAAIIAKSGYQAILPLATFMGEFYVTMGLLWALMILVGFLILGPRIGKLISLMVAPLSTAFATASSEAAYPKVLEGLERFGVSNRIASFVLPLGYSFNLDGSMLYCTFASLFIAQATGTVPTLGNQIIMLLVFMVTSKGIAGVPRASLVVIAASMASFGIPVAGMALILGVDAFLDMGRSATNVVGNSLAASVVAKWENELGEPLPDDADLDAIPAE